MELRDEICSIEPAASDSLMAPPNGFLPPSHAGSKPQSDLAHDSLMAPPNGHHHTSQAGFCTQSTSDSDTLMAPPNGDLKHLDHTGASACPMSFSGPALPIKPDPKALFFPVLDPGHSTPSPLSGSTDLLSLFNVSHMYDRFVRPYLKPTEATATGSGLVNADFKGKGKADVMMNGTGPSESTGPKRMKMEKSYGHFVADVGGRNSIKKDHQLQNWIMDPNFQESSIRDFLKPFPAETLAQSFTLQPGVLPGFDTSVWVAEEGGPKRKRKKRKQGEMAESGGPIAAAAPALLPPLPNPHPPGACSSTPISNSKEEDHRKKKRTKLGSNVSYPVPSS